MLVLIGRISEPLLAGADCHALEVVAACQSLSKQLAVAVDDKARLAVDEPLHGRCRCLSAYFEVIAGGGLGSEAERP